MFRREVGGVFQNPFARHESHAFELVSSVQTLSEPYLCKEHGVDSASSLQGVCGSTLTGVTRG